MSKKKDHEDKPGKVDGFFDFVERHKVAFNVISWGSLAVVLAAPYIRQEIADYHLMQVKIGEIERLVSCMAFGDELRDEVVEVCE